VIQTELIFQKKKTIDRDVLIEEDTLKLSNL